MLEVDVLVPISVKEHQVTTSLVHVQERKAGRERVRGQGRKGRWREGKREGRKVGRGRRRNNSSTPNWLKGYSVSYKEPHSYTYAPIPFSQRYRSFIYTVLETNIPAL